MAVLFAETKQSSDELHPRLCPLLNILTSPADFYQIPPFKLASNPHATSQYKILWERPSYPRCQHFRLARAKSMGWHQTKAPVQWRCSQLGSPVLIPAHRTFTRGIVQPSIGCRSKLGLKWKFRAHLLFWESTAVVHARR